LIIAKKCQKVKKKMKLKKKLENELKYNTSTYKEDTSLKKKKKN